MIVGKLGCTAILINVAADNATRRCCHWPEPLKSRDFPPTHATKTLFPP